MKYRFMSVPLVPNTLQMVSYFGSYLEAPALAAIGLSPEDFEPLGRLVEAGRYDEAANLVTDEMTDLAIRGTPDAVIRRIETVADMGSTQLSLGGPPVPDPDAALRRLGARCIPLFHSG